MTFTEIVDEVLSRLNLTSTTAQTRIGNAVNQKYKEITASIGLNVTRRTQVQATVTLGVQELVFTGVEKVITVIDKSSGQNRILKEITVDEMRNRTIDTGDIVHEYAILKMDAHEVTILLDTIPQTAFTLYADGYERASDLSGSQEPAFPESFHRILVESVMADELRKMEKAQLANIAVSEAARLLSDLRMFIAKSAWLDVYQGKTKKESSRTTTGSSSGSGSSSVNGASSYTQTGLITFDRDPSAPFAVSAGSAKVTNLDADYLDGESAADFHNASNLNAGTIPDARFPATLPAASGVNLTNVNAATLGGSSLSQVLQAIYPVGIVVTLGVSTNPATLFGFGTWTAIAGRVIVGRDAGQTEFDTLDETGGSKTHTLTTSEMPTHTHTVTDPGHSHTQRVKVGGGAITDLNRVTDRSGADANVTSATASTTTGITLGNAGSGTAHNNLQPYIVKYVWQRTA